LSGSFCGSQDGTHSGYAMSVREVKEQIGD
jgi:hypothetical protein